MADDSSKPLLTEKTTSALGISSIGECMMELSPASQDGLFRQGYAGDTLNTLWYLKQLCPDWCTRFVSQVGQDASSNSMVSMMDQASIDTSHIQRNPARTVGLYMISLQDGERSFSYWRGQSAARQLADDPTLIAASVADQDVVFFSGITLAILEPEARAAFLAEMDNARSAGKTVAFDPNLRPRLWADGKAMCDAIMQGASVSDIVLPSYDEEAEHFGDASIEATCARYLEVGATTVVVKNGAEGVFYSRQGETGTVMPPAVSDVVDTTSAGDSFNAGLFAGMARFDAMEDAILLAASVARQVIAQKGALVQLDLDAIHSE